MHFEIWIYAKFNSEEFCIILSLGVLACLDGYMNIALEQTEEYVGGQLKNKYGDAFIRGNNGECPMYAVAKVEMQSWGTENSGGSGGPMFN